MSLPHRRVHAHTAAHTNTHILTPGGLLSHLPPLGLSFSARSRFIGRFRWVSRVSLLLVTVTIHLQEQQHFSSDTLHPCLLAHTHTHKYTSMCTTVSLTLNRHACGALKHVTHKGIVFLTHIHTHTRTMGMQCSRLHAGLQLGYPPLFDWIYDCGSPFPISTDWLGANLSHQTPAEDKGGCGRRPVLNWNKFVMAATVYIFRIE